MRSAVFLVLLSCILAFVLAISRSLEFFVAPTREDPLNRGSGSEGLVLRSSAITRSGGISAIGLGASSLRCEEHR